MKIGQVVLAGLCVLSLFLSGCSSHRTCHPVTWSISAGSGGGVTGGSSGYDLACDGKVEVWRILQPGTNREVTQEFELECDSAEFYRTYLDKINFETISYAKTGNWTHFVELRRGEHAHRVSWTGDDGPAAVKIFHDMFMGSLNARVKK